MKIKVQNEDGRIETITIKGCVEVHEEKELDRIRTASGMEHFFTRSAYYDGWGRGHPVFDPGESLAWKNLKRHLSRPSWHVRVSGLELSLRDDKEVSVTRTDRFSTDSRWPS
jgi:hypothetical protein